MSSDFLDDRRKSLEDEFFHKQSQNDLAKLRDKLAEKTGREELKKASGMEDDAVLDKLIELGISAQTVAALSLVPLIKVAWADGEVQDSEREAILHGAEDKGIDKDSPTFELLGNWLSEHPDDSLFDAWAAYIEALRGALGEDKEDLERFDALKNQVVRFARVVAESAGGFLGIGKISKEEKAALAWIESVFSGS